MTQHVCSTSVSVDDSFRADPLLATWSRSRIKLAVRHVLHEANVVVLRQVSVFLQIRTFVLWHGGKKVFDQLVRDQRMPEVEFGDIGLCYVSVGDNRPASEASELRTDADRDLTAKERL